MHECLRDRALGSNEGIVCRRHVEGRERGDEIVMTLPGMSACWVRTPAPTEKESSVLRSS